MNWSFPVGGLDKSDVSGILNYIYPQSSFNG